MAHLNTTCKARGRQILINNNGKYNTRPMGTIIFKEDWSSVSSVAPCLIKK